MVKLVASESIRISILSYDTDVFILLVHSCVQKLLNFELLILWQLDQSLTSKRLQSLVKISSSI